MGVVCAVWLQQAWRWTTPQREWHLLTRHPLAQAWSADRANKATAMNRAAKDFLILLLLKKGCTTMLLCIVWKKKDKSIFWLCQVRNIYEHISLDISFEDIWCENTEGQAHTYRGTNLNESIIAPTFRIHFFILRANLSSE